LNHGQKTYSWEKEEKWADGTDKKPIKAKILGWGGGRKNVLGQGTWGYVPLRSDATLRGKKKKCVGEGQGKIALFGEAGV